jgi:hypothetical protein
MKKLFEIIAASRETLCVRPAKGRRTSGPLVPTGGRVLLRLGILLFGAALSVAHAHDHVEVGLDPSEPSRLSLDGPSYQLALYVPRGEPFSGYLPQFPGGWHACELTFTTEVNALDPAVGADPRIEIVSVSGPVGGSFAFWEVGATSPTWSLPTGWSGTGAAFPVVLNGDDHAHGRAFTMDKPGTYTVVFRAVDAADEFAVSANKTITVVAQQPPKLSIGMQSGNVALSFTSRLNLVYDLQVCTDLEIGNWTNVELHTLMDGTGGAMLMTDPVAGRVRAFYRLVEYQ